MSDSFCSECGAYKANKPQVELERDAAFRAWYVNIVQTRDDGEYGIQIEIPDHGEIRAGRPQQLVEGARLFL